MSKCLTMRCELCGKATRCTCRWWGCGVCWATNNRIVSVQNMMLKMWLTKQEVKDNLETIRLYTNKVDEATLFEYLRWIITEEQLQEEVDKYNPTKKKPYVNNHKFTPREWNNPSKKHEYEWTSPWSHCIWCGWLKKYVDKYDCTKYKWEENNENS